MIGEVVLVKRLIWLTLLAGVCAGCAAKEPPRSGGRTASAWADVLQQSDVELRRKAATKLGPLVLTDPAAMPALLRALEDWDPQVRLAAARSLGIYTGGRANEVLPALREVQQRDQDVRVREAASKAIHRLGTLPAERLRPDVPR